MSWYNDKSTCYRQLPSYTSNEMLNIFRRAENLESCILDLSWGIIIVIAIGISNSNSNSNNKRFHMNVKESVLFKHGMLPNEYWGNA